MEESSLVRCQPSSSHPQVINDEGATNGDPLLLALH